MFEVKSTSGKLLFYADEQEVVVGAERLRVMGEWPADMYRNWLVVRIQSVKLKWLLTSGHWCWWCSNRGQPPNQICCCDFGSCLVVVGFDLGIKELKLLLIVELMWRVKNWKFYVWKLKLGEESEGAEFIFANRSQGRRRWHVVLRQMSFVLMTGDKKWQSCSDWSSQSASQWRHGDSWFPARAERRNWG